MEPWALRVSAFPDEASANVVAERLRASGRPARIEHWLSPSSGPVYDVYIDGFEDLAEANAAALELREEGYEPELAVIPIEAPSKP